MSENREPTPRFLSKDEIMRTFIAEHNPEALEKWMIPRFPREGVFSHGGYNSQPNGKGARFRRLSSRHSFGLRRQTRMRPAFFLSCAA